MQNQQPRNKNKKEDTSLELKSMQLSEEETTRTVNLIEKKKNLMKTEVTLQC